MEYVLGIAGGILYGGVIGLIKYLFMWRRVLKDNDKSITMKMVSNRLILSMVINVAVLASTLILKDSQTVDFAAFAIAAAVSLSLAGRFFSIQKVLQKSEIIDEEK